MSVRTDAIRAKIVAMAITDARNPMQRLVRYAARNRVYQYAIDNRITDFADTVLVEQTHRNSRQSVIDAASAQVAEVQAATTIAELLAVFDQLEPWLD